MSEFGFSVVFDSGGEARVQLRGTLTPKEAKVTKALVDMWCDELHRRIDRATVVPAFPAPTPAAEPAK